MQKVKKVSNRLKYLGRTPGKTSKTGEKVIEAMKKEGKIRTKKGVQQFKASDGKWYDMKYADMSHKKDAVTWWNKTGRKYGAKSEKVRKWMLDSKNYDLDHRSINRSAGAKLGQVHLPPKI
ncbi:GH-E family nuclease [Chryseobacterium caseinilyticum]|nr:GH-E family nuclease [Chryseobacterium caseinilyticum]